MPCFMQYCKLSKGYVSVFFDVLILQFSMRITIVKDAGLFVEEIAVYLKNSKDV